MIFFSFFLLIELKVTLTTKVLYNKSLTVKCIGSYEDKTFSTR